jgi:hypothetical protein
MAYATVKGRRYEVRVTQDLTDNYSIEVYPPAAPGAVKRSEPFKNWPVPIVMKIHADSRAHALIGGLEHLKKLGEIDEFHVEDSERPPPEVPKVPKPPPAAT